MQKGSKESEGTNELTFTPKQPVLAGLPACLLPKQKETRNMAIPRPAAFDRLMAKCVETNPPEGCQIATPCLTYTGCKKTSGHGRIWDNGKMAHAHRVAFEHKHGPIPKGMVVMHLCDNPACCNPDHLTLGTQKDNTHDAVLKGRHTNKHALPNLIKRICHLQGSGKTPEQIADETGFALTEILTALDFLDEDEACIHALTLEKHGADFADSQRLGRFIHYQHSFAAITALFA